MKKKTWLSWSSGKDSAFALYKLQQEKDIIVEGLITTITSDYDRVSMHSTRISCLKAQARSLGLPLKLVKIPKNCSNEIYENQFITVIKNAKSNGVEYIAYGDLFLEDVKKYREKLHSSLTLDPIFPIWGLNTKSLAETLLESGFEAYLTCVDLKKLPLKFAGRKYDLALLNDLPNDVDPCGENGEFHTFVFRGPNFKNNISCSVGEVVQREGFGFADVILD